MRPDPAYLGYRAGSAVSRALPSFVLGPVEAALGHLGPRLMADRAAQVARHQQRVRPDLAGADLDRAVRHVFESYAAYWLESFRLPGTSPAALEAGITVDGYEHVEAALAQGEGAILALPHLGGWEWAAFWMTRCRGAAVTAVAEPVEPPELAAWFVGLREALGMEVIPLGPEAGAGSVRALAANRVLALVCDRDIGGGGVEVEFFGERTTLPGGPATLALRTGAALIPAAVYLEDGHHHGVALPPLDATRRGRLREDVTRLTQELAHLHEDLIRRAPEQWHLMQPNWPSDRG